MYEHFNTVYKVLLIFISLLAHSAIPSIVISFVNVTSNQLLKLSVKGVQVTKDISEISYKDF